MKRWKLINVLGGLEEIMVEGTWPEDDLRRAFVAGAKWWEFYKTQFTMWPSDRDIAETEAERRYPGGAIRLIPHTADAACAQAGEVDGETRGAADV